MLACVIYRTIPSFWLMIHPFAERWRTRRSPYRILVPAWMAMWVIAAIITEPWRHVALFEHDGRGFQRRCSSFVDFILYSRSGKNFSTRQLSGLPEVQGAIHRQQRLITDESALRVRHPVYLAPSLLRCWRGASGRDWPHVGDDGVRRGHGRFDDPDGNAN